MLKSKSLLTKVAVASIAVAALFAGAASQAQARTIIEYSVINVYAPDYIWSRDKVTACIMGEVVFDILGTSSGPYGKISYSHMTRDYWGRYECNYLSANKVDGWYYNPLLPLAEREVDDPCLTRSGEQCEKPEQDHCPGLRQGVMSGEIGIEDLLKECPEFPPNDPLCNGKDDANNPNEMGGVACSGPDYKPCFWPKPGFNRVLQDPQARQIAYQCIVQHEQHHIDTSTRYSGVCRNDGSLGAENYPYLHLTEISAYKAESQCLEEGILHCNSGNQACIDQIRDRIRDNEATILQEKARHLLSCMKAENMGSAACDFNNWPELNNV